VIVIVLFRSLMVKVMPMMKVKVMVVTIAMVIVEVSVMSITSELMMMGTRMMVTEKDGMEAWTVLPKQATITKDNWSMCVGYHLRYE
jgi:hypothetical protein